MPGSRNSVETPDDLLAETRPLVIATILRGDGITGVDTHIRQLRKYLDESGMQHALVTPYSWARTLTYPIFGFRRLLLRRCSRPASVAWYLRWHEVFLRNALRRHLAEVGNCVVYAQDPAAARAALRARRGPHQRVVMAVHLRISMADEWADKGEITRGGRTFRAIRALEREVIPQVDGLVYVSQWAQDALAQWLPEALAVPSAVVDNFVAPLQAAARQEAIGDLVTVGNLQPVKNHQYLIRVLSEARRAGYPYTLDVFGDGQMKHQLQELTKSLGMEGLVRLRGYRPDVRDLLPGYRAYVHASYSESSSFAIIEAMAAGLPVIAGNTGPLSELFEDRVEGRFWPLDDPIRAAATLIELIENETVRSAAGAAALARFQREFDAHLIAPRLLSFVMGAGSTVSRSRPSQAIGKPARRARRPITQVEKDDLREPSS